MSDRLELHCANNGRWLVVAPSDAGEFYISGTGHLCARHPLKHAVFDESLGEAGLPAGLKVSGRASAVELASVGLDLGASAIVLEIKLQ